jgi:hypothetical protein
VAGFKGEPGFIYRRCAVSTRGCSRRIQGLNQIEEDVAGGGEIGPGVPGIGSSSGMSPGNSSGLCGAPGSRTGGGTSGRGFPGGSSGGGSVGFPGVIGGSSGSIGIVSRPLRYAS